MTDRSEEFTESEYRVAVSAAPSTLASDEPSLARLLAVVGLFAAVLGVAAVVANQYGPRMITMPAGVLLGAVGFSFLFFHAFRDTDADIRRMYGLAGAIFVFAAIVVSLIPGRAEDQGVRTIAYFFLPWGAALGAAGILFLIAFTCAETDDALATSGANALLSLGSLLVIAPVVAAVPDRDTLLGPGPVLALLGLMALGGAFVRLDLSAGRGRVVACCLGVLGATLAFTALAYSIFPTILHDGPAVLKRPNQTYDAWKVLGRAGSIVISLAGTAAALRFTSWHPWVRGGLLAVTLVAAALFLYATFEAPIQKPPVPFLVPYGVILAAIGLLYLAVSVGAVSEAPFVVLTRRELAAYFCSPIAYIVLTAVTVMGGVGYSLFRGFIMGGNDLQSLGPTPRLEPILSQFVPGSVIGPIIVPFLVAGLTMRLFAEEKRSGTLDVLFTAPVSDAAVLFSKFTASWFFFVLCWVPPCLLLLGLRIENGVPFDFRPLLSFFLAVAVTGVEFIAIGMFFSSLTRNQVVAAFLTLSVIAAEWAMFWHQFSSSLSPTLHTICDRLSYWTLWNSALGGQLAVRDCVLHLSIGVLFLFLTAKSLEARKWT